MFILAYPEDIEHIAYFDASGNKYIAKGGTLAWRINNPGLVQTHSHVAKRNGSIGACGSYAIFPTPEHGHKALSSWLRLKKYFNATLKLVAKHYQPNDPEGFIFKLNARKKGHSQEDVIQLLAYRDAHLHINPFNPDAIEYYISQRIDFYKEAFENLGNVTVLDPDTFVQHGFDNKCYQTVLCSLVDKYQQQVRNDG